MVSRSRLRWHSGKDCGPAVHAEVAHFGVHGHDHLVLFGQPDDVLYKFFGHDALAVIGQHNAVEPVRNPPFDELEELLVRIFSDPVLGLAVEPDDLLAVGDDAGLDRRRSAGLRDKAVGRNFLGVQQMGELFPRVIGADHSADADVSAERMDVLYNIRRSAEQQVFLRDVHHGDRRFRRYAGDLSPDVMVEYDVSDHKNPGRRETVNVRIEPLALLFRNHGLLFPPCILVSVATMDPMEISLFMSTGIFRASSVSQI